LTTLDIILSLVQGLGTDGYTTLMFK
jgi:hypothetical protein